MLGRTQHLHFRFRELLSKSIKQAAAINKSDSQPVYTECCIERCIGLKRANISQQ